MRHNRIMNEKQETCRHEWRYYVDLTSKGVRARRCERCGERSLIATSREPLPLSA